MFDALLEGVDDFIDMQFHLCFLKGVVIFIGGLAGIGGRKRILPIYFVLLCSDTFVFDQIDDSDYDFYCLDSSEQHKKSQSHKELYQ